MASPSRDAGESGLKGENKSDPNSLAALDPRALFDKYDADGSGAIDFDEFKVLLHDLGVSLTEPKARAYFKRCDRRRRGGISFDEFRLALYTCDPKNPDRTGGLCAGSVAGAQGPVRDVRQGRGGRHRPRDVRGAAGVHRPQAAARQDGGTLCDLRRSRARDSSDSRLAGQVTLIWGGV
ncbi:hypothetical protein PR003_g31636 [Phytophthora rubi]|uniref:EF-hand domain-containing protein n=1 Tax=Phytophthora rubi TaxID=129364 RepID=A0A6A4B4V6_9STRA|nr:hypothetical protein PR003_g31636 [Phytophthora rubi]